MHDTQRLNGTKWELEDRETFVHRHPQSATRKGCDMEIVGLTTQTETSDDAWPGDRIPSAGDAQIAYQPPDPNALAIFKQAMYADSDARVQRQILSVGHVQTLEQQVRLQNSVS
jgi:hypothetical protein